LGSAGAAPGLKSSGVHRSVKSYTPRHLRSTAASRSAPRYESPRYRSGRARHASG
jgi:hypothetical protein